MEAEILTTEVILPFWPSCLQNVQWSRDDWIAVAGGGSLAILVPRLDEIAPGGVVKWDHALVKVDAFTQDDIPLMSPLSRKNWSLGEELTSRSIHSLRWSMPGIGKNFSCVLAILYSDHNLVIWECRGRPELSRSWKPALVVNHTLRQHYATSTGAVATDEDVEVKQRVSSFAWSPENDTAENDHSSYNDCRTPRTRRHLAVSTGAQEIVILDVRTTYSILYDQDDAPGASWTCSIAYRIPFTLQAPDSPPSLLSTSTTMLEMVWAGAECDDLSLITILIGGSLYYADVYAYYKGGYEQEISVMNTMLPDISALRGPLHVLANGHSVACFTISSMLIVDVLPITDGDPPLIIQQTIRSNWSEVAGVSSVQRNDGTICAHLCTHLACDLFEDSCLLIGLDNGKWIRPHIQKTPAWQARISQAHKDFTTAYSLSGNALVRTHGLASMPTGLMVAVCVSMLPKDSAAHVISSDQKCSVYLEGGEQDSSHAGQHTATSRVLNALYNNHAGIASGTISEAQLMEAFSDLTRFPPPTGTALPVENNHGTVIRYLEQQFYHTKAVRRVQAEILAHLVQHKTGKAKVVPDVYLLITTAVQQASKFCSDDGILTIAVKACHRKFQRTQGNIDAMIPPGDWTETCFICDLDISFEAVRWARCNSGHRFTRCALTLLAIPEPSVARTCSLCSTQYLDPQCLPSICAKLCRRLEDADKDKFGVSVAQKEPEVSFARLLLTACKNCIMCGGRFNSA